MVFLGTGTYDSEMPPIERTVGPSSTYPDGLPEDRYALRALLNLHRGRIEMCLPGKVPGFEPNALWLLTDYRNRLPYTLAHLAPDMVIIPRSGTDYTIAVDVYDDALATPDERHVAGRAASVRQAGPAKTPARTFNTTTRNHAVAPATDPNKARPVAGMASLHPAAHRSA